MGLMMKLVKNNNARFLGTCRSLFDTLDTKNKFSFEAKEKLP